MNTSAQPTHHGAPIAVDAMGGDLGSAVVVEGVVQAARDLGISTILVGKEAEIRARLDSLGALSEPLVTIHNAPDVITMEDSPSVAIRGKPEASVRVAFELVKRGEASAVISPGNTGAVMAAGVFVCGTLAGIARPAIATLIPRVGDRPPVVLLDSGANVDCHANQLVQFALMGKYYARSAALYQNPRVALLSNGTELTKGNDIIRSAAVQLAEMSEINFVGYVEGRDIAKDVTDVILCDGFLGNITLKTMEGSVELVIDSIKHYVEKSFRGRIGMWLAKPVFRSLFRDKLDPSSYGGAPLLGLREIAIICHGSSNSRAIFNAVRVAKKFVDERLVDSIGGALSGLDLKVPGGYEDMSWDRMGQRFDKKKKNTRNGTGSPEESEYSASERNKE